MTKILITGGAGFVGSHTAELLLDHKHEVLVVDDFSTGKSENLVCFCDRGGDVEVQNITDYPHMVNIFSIFNPQVVIHLAAQPAISTSINDPAFDLTVNAIGTITMLKLAQEYGVKRFIFSSTSAVYDERIKAALTEKSARDPQSPYGISKLAAESYIRYYFPKHLILRYGNIYGPRQHPLGQNQVVARAFRHFLRGDPFYITGDGRQKRDFTFVGDIARLNAEMVTAAITGTFNASTGISHSVNDVLTCISMIYGVQNYPWEHSHEKDPRGSVFMDVRNTRKNLGWTAEISLVDGLKETARWWHDYLKLGKYEDVNE